MAAIDCINKLVNLHLPFERLRFCFVDENKRPFKVNGEIAKPNCVEDFCRFEDLVNSEKLFDFVGVGISIQASKIFAIDVDHCFSKDGNIRDDRANDILQIFHDKAYCEFSFSGTGLRVLFNANLISDYSLKYYIKNEKNQIEFYQPTNSFRYVTLTGRTLYDNFSTVNNETLSAFLEKYMKRPVRAARKVEKVDDADIETLKKRVKFLYLKSHDFQELWFGKAPGSGKDESERDYHLINLLYSKITQDPQKIKLLFESSPYFKSKDWKHIKKWEQQNGRYFNYVFARISEETT